MTHIGMYKVTAKTALVSGQWYYGFTCSPCGHRYGVFDDPSGGVRPLPMLGDGTFYCLCPACKAPGYFKFTDVAHFQA